jgi:cell division transport system ATP-binding protein
MIEFRNVTKVYSTGIAAVNDTSLYIEKGEFVFIVGASGSGKSTLMKMIMKEVEPTSGHIFVNGIDITKISKRRIPNLRRSMGIVFQDFRLLPDMTVYENVAYAMRVIETNPKLIKRQVPNALSLVGLLDKADLYPDQLSGGEQQRVAVARAIVNNPAVLIADEPTGNLDPDTAWEIMSLLSDINRRGTTVVVATHAKDIVDKMQKRVVVMEKGNVFSDKENSGYSKTEEEEEEDARNEYFKYAGFSFGKRKAGV